MSTAELIEAIKALPPEKFEKVAALVTELTTEPELGGIHYAGEAAVKAASERIFRENAELFQKLAR